MAPQTPFFLFRYTSSEGTGVKLFFVLVSKTMAS